MSAVKNQAAWLREANTPLVVEDAPLHRAGAEEIVVKNAAVAINPLDCHMQDAVFVQQWPTIIGCDVAGGVYEVGSGVDRFRKGDCVVGSVLRRRCSLACTDAVPPRPLHQPGHGSPI